MSLRALYTSVGVSNVLRTLPDVAFFSASICRRKHSNTAAVQQRDFYFFFTYEYTNRSGERAGGGGVCWLDRDKEQYRIQAACARAPSCLRVVGMVANNRDPLAPGRIDCGSGFLQGPSQFLQHQGTFRRT